MDSLFLFGMGYAVRYFFLIYQLNYQSVII